MACQNNSGNTSCGNTCSTPSGNTGYVVIIVLYILLAIILGSFLAC